RGRRSLAGSLPVSLAGLGGGGEPGVLPTVDEAGNAAALNGGVPRSGPVPVASAGSPRSLSRAVWVLSAVVLALGYGREFAAAAAGIESRSFGLADIRLDAESALSVWYSATLMLASALLMLLLARHERSPGGRSIRRYWGALGIVFIFLSADETI